MLKKPRGGEAYNNTWPNKCTVETLLIHLDYPMANHDKIVVYLKSGGRGIQNVDPSVGGW